MVSLAPGASSSGGVAASAERARIEVPSLLKRVYDEAAPHHTSGTAGLALWKQQFPAVDDAAPSARVGFDMPSPAASASKTRLGDVHTTAVAASVACVLIPMALWWWRTA